MGIRVNSVNPTVVLTDMGKMAWSDEAKAGPMLARIPQGKFAVPEDVARTVMFLLSPASDMVNGAMVRQLLWTREAPISTAVQVPIDGGLLTT